MALIRIKKNNPFLIFAVTLGLLVFLYFVGALRPLERIIFLAVKPLGGQAFSFGNKFDSTFSEEREKDELLLEIERLQQAAALAVIDDAYCQEVITENSKLRSQLAFNSEYKFKTVMANIIAKEGLSSVSGSGSRDIIIDRGSRDGLRTELAVLSEEGIIIGKITEVKEGSARVCLTTSPGCQLAASLQNEVKTQGITDGRLGLTIEMNYIPQLDQLVVGETVITSGLSESIPRGLVIGRIASFTSESNEVWQSATIEPLINLNNLTIVSIIIP